MRLLAILLTLLPGLAIAQSIDPRDLSRGEVRAIQTVLSAADTYEGLIDGAWGRGSERAAIAATGGGTLDRADWGNLATRWDRLASETGWDIRPVGDYELALGLPWQVMSVARESGNRIELTASDGSLEVRVERQSEQQMMRDHADLGARATDGDPYRVDRGERRVTSSRLSGDRLSYLRSEPSGNGWISVLMISPRSARAVFDPAVASIYYTRSISIGFERGSALASLGTGGQSGGGSLLDTLDDPLPTPRASRSASGLSVVPSGVGVRVNNTDILTANRIVAGCRQITINGQTGARLIARDRETGLALITSGTHSRDWLPVADGLVTDRAVTSQGPGLRAERGFLAGRVEEGTVASDLRVQDGMDGAALTLADGTLAALALDMSDRNLGLRAVEGDALTDFLEANRIAYRRSLTGPSVARTDVAMENIGAATVTVSCN